MRAGDLIIDSFGREKGGKKKKLLKGSKKSQTLGTNQWPGLSKGLLKKSNKFSI